MIQRYGIRHDVLKGTPDGEFVSYKDHRELLDKANEAIREAYHRGREQGMSDERVRALSHQWVKYEDHQAELERAKAEIFRLKRELLAPQTEAVHTFTREEWRL